MDVFPDEEVKKFVGDPITTNPLLDVENPVSYGGFDRPNFYMEHKKTQLEGILKAEEVTKKVFTDFAKKFGRGASDLIDEYQTNDAEIAVVVLGSTAGTLRRTIDQLREEGVKVGLVRPKIFRPFPSVDLKKSLSKFKKVLILDRMFPAGASFGPLFSETAAAFINEKNTPELKNAIYGLGGRETNHEDFAEVIKNYNKLSPIAADWINVRE